MNDLFDTSDLAQISPNGLYRYSLIRNFNDACGKRVAFVMLNPSTADGRKNDPTVRRCIDFAKQWGYNSLLVLNIFAYRATDPAQLKLVSDPVGPDNEKTFKRLLPTVDQVICAWGRHGEIAIDGIPQGIRALHWIQSSGKTPMALKLTKNGHPSHPLYLNRGLKPEIIQQQQHRK